MISADVSTRDKPGTIDALETAKPGEPIFVLQGGDPLAPATVLHWADLARTAGRAAVRESEAERLLKRAGEAENVAWAMQSYQRGETAVEVDSAAVGVVERVDQDERRARIAAVGKLHNAAGTAQDALEALTAVGFSDGIGADLQFVVTALGRIAGEVEPRRGSERS